MYLRGIPKTLAHLAVRKMCCLHSGAICLLVNALWDFISIPYLPAIQWDRLE